MMKMYKIGYESPLGFIEIIGSDKAILSIMFTDERIEEVEINGVPSAVKQCYEQLDEYFKGERMEFSFPIQLEGTDFQKSVWNSLKGISYAQTESYRDIAVSIGNEKASRAVGNANGKNKLSIVVPCHRVIGSTGKLTGYAGELWRKEWLLKHERSCLDRKSSTN